MSISTEEQRLNRNRLLLILPKCGLSAKQVDRIEKIIKGATPDSAPRPSRTYQQLRYGDGCISPDLPSWTGRLAEPPDEIL